MPRKPRWVVRIVTMREELDGEGSSLGNHTIGEFIECMRYAGMIKIHRDDGTGMCFDLLPPGYPGIDTRIWAQMNADRMKSFGFNAECAPDARPET